MDAFERWVQAEWKKRTAGVTDQALLEAIPHPTPEEFDMLLDPASIDETDFISDYQ